MMPKFSGFHEGPPYHYVCMQCRQWFTVTHRIMVFIKGCPHCGSRLVQENSLLRK